MSTNTIRLHRVLRAPPGRIYRAFLDADAMAKWLPPNGFIGKVHQLQAKVGGTYKMSFTNFSTGHSHSFCGEYLELVPDQRIRHTDKFDDPNLPGVMTTTISLTKVSCGTELNVVQEGVPAAIALEACYLGWQESLALLAKLVEAEIPRRASLFGADVYVRITRNLFRVKNISSGTEAQGIPERPFTSTRLLVGDFTSAERTLKLAVAEVLGKSLLALRPNVLMHPLEMVEGGLSEIEERVLRELATGAGAKKVVLWIGGELSDPEVSARLKEQQK